MKTLIRSLILLILTQSSIAGADTNFSPELKQFTLTLMDKGIDQVGQFNLPEFYAELDNIQWHITDQPFSQPAVDAPGVTITVGPGSQVTFPGAHIPEEERPYRESARYNINQVYLSDDIVKLKPSDSRTQIILHEALGALGYNDHHSAQSSSLILLQKYPELAPALGDSFFNARSLIYGGSSVGGGGDFDSIDLKQKVLNHIMSKSVDSNFLSNYAGITFEPMDEPQNQRVMIMYEFNRKGFWGKPRFKGVRQDRRYEELITVLFPRKSWIEASTRVKGQIIQFISYGILSVFPTTPDQLEIDPYHTTCNGEPLLLPKERSSNADLVLRFRANMIADCRPRTGSNYNKVGFEVDMPRSALR